MQIFIKYKLYFIIFTLILTGASIYLFYEPEVYEEIEEVLIKEEEPKIIEPPILLTVDIKGEVKKPGVYQLDNDKRVIDVIKMAGGLTKESDTLNINLSKLLTDEMVIVIYNKDSIKQIEYIEIEKECPACNDACVCECNYPQATDKVSITNASLEELQTLPGIGESKALDIVEYRNNNSFNTIEDIMNVTGIGEATFAKIKEFITL